ncbi:hypothetical protein DPEC_G00110340 [Dallia pectoralis]|uniref:Uncharacterized protein n=1 Tax=Dallia pectoralis TaxID=75939 RepID=A0ACC2GT09_DALPE|nr:hypothetical protein DPEC_G00110340 [Dallia pectoralis]
MCISHSLCRRSRGSCDATAFLGRTGPVADLGVRGRGDRGGRVGRGERLGARRLGQVRPRRRNTNVLLLTTLHADALLSDSVYGKPAVVLDYNCNKGGMDNLDKIVGICSCHWMTARWPLAVFHNILYVSSYNAFVIWREVRPDWMPRRVFL